MRYSKKFELWLALCVFAATSLTTASLPVSAADDRELEEVVVTGSRIKRDAGTYVGPMTVMDGGVIEEMPTMSLTDALFELPSVGRQGIGRNDANGGRGANLAGIHQLEPERTLVVFDGRRSTSTIVSSSNLGVDLQSFPVNMIDRVEVLADGASAIYGSDAVSGVINLIPKKNFSGFEVSFGAGSPSDEGGDHLDAGLLFGIDGERGYFTAGLTYVDDGDVDFQDRSWSRIPLLGQLNSGNGILNLVGSGIPPEGRLTSDGGGILFKPDASTGASFTPYDTFCLTTASGGDATGSIECILRQGHRFNYNDIPSGVSLINANQAVNFTGIGELTFDSGIVGIFTTTLAHREGRLNFTPLPVQGAAGRFTDLVRVPLSNPNIPADFRTFLSDRRLANDPGCDAACLNADFQMSYRGLDFGPRTFDYDSDTLSGTVGLRGSLGELGMSGALEDWEWDGWLTVGRSRLYEVTHGQLNVANLAISVDPAHCALVASCPKDQFGNPTMNIFGRSEKSDEEIEFATFDDIERTDYDMVHWGFALGGQLASLPAGALGFAGGIEYREEQGGVQTSGVVQAGDSGGNFAEPTRGEYDVTEAYAEFNVPILSGAPMAEDLSLDVAFRWSDYSSVGDESTYKVALAWAPVEQVKFRGTLSTGFRSPNILELFGGISDTFLTVGDPCTAPITDPNVQANCTADGVPAGFVQPAAQLKISQGGNTELIAETSDNFSFGVVWTPEFADLRVAVDWYDVEITDAIGTPDAGQVINACYNSPGGALSAPECVRIDRGPDGSVVRYDLLLENLDTIETSGLDLDATYSLNTRYGLVTVHWLLNYLDEFKEITTTGIVTDNRGLVEGAVGSNNGYPEFKSNLGLSLTREDWSASVQWRHMDEMAISDVFGFDNINTTADAVNYVDFTGSYKWNNWTVTAGVQNTFDEEPPYVPDVSTNTSAVYDFLGRFYFARVNFVIE